MQVVILAAGRGERFVSNGVVTPKPLLPARGKTMIQRALEQAAEVNKAPVVVCLLDLYAALHKHTPKGMYPVRVPVRFVQKGAAMSVLAATGVIRDTDPVLIMDCDTVFAPGVLTKFATFAETCFSAGTQSAMLCFKPSDESARYSFVNIKDNLVEQVVEKVRISGTASCGVHAFQTWELAKRAIYEMVILSTMTNGEYYLAPAHNNLLITTAMIIGANEFTHVGTPAELEAYEQAIPKA